MTQFDATREMGADSDDGNVKECREKRNISALTSSGGDLRAEVDGFRIAIYYRFG